MKWFRSFVLLFLTAAPLLMLSQSQAAESAKLNEKLEQVRTQRLKVEKALIEGEKTQKSTDQQIQRLKSLQKLQRQEKLLTEKRLKELDLFDRDQLAKVIQVCRRSKSLSDAGRTLFNVSRTKKKSSNDSDRLRKYLAKFGLSWGDINAEY